MVTRRRKGPPGRRRSTRGRSRSGAFFAVAGVLVLVVGFGLGLLVGRRSWFPGTESPPEAPPPDTSGTRTPPVEEPVARAPEAPVDVPVSEAPGGEGAYVSLVIDDLGRDLQVLDSLAGLGIDLSYAVLPYEPLTQQVVDVLGRRGEEILCHLPMEAENGANPGPGALTSTMGGKALARATERALDAVPGAVGVNNHMGSYFSARASSMRSVLRVLEVRGLFFLDSRTSADSVGYDVAMDMGIPAVKRHVFLDGDSRPEAIRGQFLRLLAQARAQGSAVAIGHPYAVTVEVLRREIPRAQSLGYRFVKVSNLLDRNTGPPE